MFHRKKDLSVVGYEPIELLLCCLLIFNLLNQVVKFRFRGVRISYLKCIDSLVRKCGNKIAAKL